MDDLPRAKGKRVLCPERCNYRDKNAPFCGVCIPKILNELGLDRKRKEKTHGRKEENRDRNSD